MLSLDEKETVKNELLHLNKITKWFSFGRLLIGIGFIVLVICLITLDQFKLYLCLSAGAIVLFLLVSEIGNPYFQKVKNLKNRELVFKKHENRRNLSYQSFSPDGREHVIYEDYKQLDLDLLGPRSLFQYLCVAKSKAGREKLAKQLTNPEQKTKEFQDCVYQLSQTTDALKLEASIATISAEAKDCDSTEILGIAKKQIKIQPLGLCLMALSYVACIGLLVFFLLNHIAPYYLLGFVVLNFFIAKVFTKNDVFSINSTKYMNFLESYVELAKDVIDLQFENPYFDELKSVLKEELPFLIQFKRNFEMLSYRKNVILSILGNGLLYMDYILIAILNHTNKKIGSIEKSLDALSEVELLLSLATIGLDNEVYSIPLANEELTIEIQGGYHPLVKNCVANDFTFQSGVILTGSNMSGKTTFMRMLGVNQILANAGGLVCASYFRAPRLKVVTSLRANDMLQEGISTFYAEIHRMKTIISSSEKEKTLVLVDEIFKGTNAKDRIFASKEIIKKLNSMQCLFLITTHDFELCEVEHIKNYHFDEEYIEDKITFDYQIKNGKCQRTNAIYLLRMAGVLDNQ